MATNEKELTPMQRQYNEIKARNQDCILFFRLGDFYEMFNDDARVASRELDLTLTTRDRSKPKEEEDAVLIAFLYGKILPLHGRQFIVRFGHWRNLFL